MQHCWMKLITDLRLLTYELRQLMQKYHQVVQVPRQRFDERVLVVLRHLLQYYKDGTNEVLPTSASHPTSKLYWLNSINEKVECKVRAIKSLQ
ncbi:hypothetical protein BVC80_1747g9 [Macleaya cordata]|uniref:Uncharacterized protein n=1 Tax=Macleaya cordata TaxID=56857 RepID=A0A200QKU2_MACCD|nr:hypothetical protein BVC80_1747g9 [Macleaya cordata]